MSDYNKGRREVRESKDINRGGGRGVSTSPTNPNSKSEISAFARVKKLQEQENAEKPKCETVTRMKKNRRTGNYEKRTYNSCTGWK